MIRDEISAGKSERVGNKTRIGCFEFTARRRASTNRKHREIYGDENLANANLSTSMCDRRQRFSIAFYFDNFTTGRNVYEVSD